MRTLLYQQSNIQIFHEEDEGWLYADWTGLQSVDEVHRGCEQILLLMSARRLDSVLNDNSNVEGIWIGASEWVGRDWFPRMRKAGLRNFAWVYSPARFSQVSTDATLRAAIPGTAEVFWSVEEAENWLRQQRRKNAARTQRIVLPPDWREQSP